MISQAAAEAALLDGVVGFRVERDVIVASGADAAAYLQGQVSQQVEGLAVGESRWSFVLQPQGKVDAWLRITRTSDTEFWLDLDAGSVDVAVARLERFKLRMDVTIEPSTQPWLAVRGPRADEPPQVAAGSIAAAVDWPGQQGYDVLGPAALDDPGVPIGPPEALEMLRITTAQPRMGAELDDGTIPAEVGADVVERSADFTKGCYTGQELVARVESRGSNTPRHLYRVVMPAPSAGTPQPGAELLVDGAAAGHISSAVTKADGSVVALALVRRAVTPPASATIGDDRAQVLAPGEAV